jgi:hypothetical protein
MRKTLKWTHPVCNEGGGQRRSSEEIGQEPALYKPLICLDAKAQREQPLPSSIDASALTALATPRLKNAQTRAEFVVAFA